MKKIFLICPVRNASENQKAFMMDYIAKLESEGNKVHYPARDTNQVDPTGGWQICTDNSNAIKNADEVHIFWDDTSTGTLFDLGVAFASGKPLAVINSEDINISNTKSFHNLINYWFVNEKFR